MAEVTGPLNAKGILVSVDGQPVTPERGSRLRPGGRGTSPLHVSLRGRDPRPGAALGPRPQLRFERGDQPAGRAGPGGVTVSGDDLPEDVEQIPIRPVWQLSDDEERRTKQVEVRFASTDAGRTTHGQHFDADGSLDGQSDAECHARALEAAGSVLIRLSELLDETAKRSWIFSRSARAGLGAAHAIQPGHGKTLVTAVASGRELGFISPRCWGWRRRWLTWEACS